MFICQVGKYIADPCEKTEKRCAIKILNIERVSGKIKPYLIKNSV